MGKNPTTLLISWLILAVALVIFVYYVIMGVLYVLTTKMPLYVRIGLWLAFLALLLMLLYVIFDRTRDLRRIAYEGYKRKY